MSQLLNNTNKLNQNFNLYANEVTCNNLVADATTIDGTLNVETVDAVNVNSVNGTFAKLETTTFTASQANMAGITFSGDLTNSTTLNSYTEGDIVFTVTGPPAAPQTVTGHYVKIGRNLTLNIPTFQFASSNAAVYTFSGLPVELEPMYDTSVIVAVSDAGASQAAMGSFEIYRGDAAYLIKNIASVNFSNSGLCGCPDGFNITYSV